MQGVEDLVKILPLMQGVEGLVQILPPNAKGVQQLVVTMSYHRYKNEQYLVYYRMR